MVNQIISSAMALAVTFFLLINSAAAEKFGKDDEWLIYMYICGTNLEEDGHQFTKNIAEMQGVNLPKNVKVLINVNGSRLWHHPTIKEGGNGYYLYTGKILSKLENKNENMGDSKTLANFLRYGEDNFNPDHRILMFFNHGGLNGLCYDETFKKPFKKPVLDNKGNIIDYIIDYKTPNLSYDNLTEVFSAVYSNSPEQPPFELIAFDTCLSSSYELANSIADFSHYMLGSEPSMYGWYLTECFSALAKDPSMNGVKFGKILCNSTMKSYKNWPEAISYYPKDFQNTQAFSIIDLTKMDQLRTSNEEFFGKALELSNESNGFSGAFARAVYAKNSDNYSNEYTDLGLLAKNTKDLMPKESQNLKKAINKAVVYNKRGAYLNATGISTAYPYVSAESGNISQDDLKDKFLTQDSMPDAQKDFYEKLMELNTSNLQGLELTWDKTGNIVAELEPEQIENVLKVRALMFQPNDDTSGEIWVSDDIKIDRKKGTVTENIRPVYHTIDGHRITMVLTYEGRGYKFYEVPIILKKRNIEKADLCFLQVRYDISKNEYSILGIGNEIDNGMVVQKGRKIDYGDIITPLFWTLGALEDGKNSQADDLFKYSYIKKDYETDPKTRKPVIKERIVNNTLTGEMKEFTVGDQRLFFKRTAGESFVYSQNSKIIEKKVSRGDYMGVFQFFAPNGTSSSSLPFTISVRYGEIYRDFIDESDLNGKN